MKVNEIQHQEQSGYESAMDFKEFKGLKSEAALRFLRRENVDIYGPLREVEYPN